MVSAPVGHTTDRPLQEPIMGALDRWLDGDPHDPRDPRDPRWTQAAGDR